VGTAHSEHWEKGGAFPRIQGGRQWCLVVEVDLEAKGLGKRGKFSSRKRLL